MLFHGLLEDARQVGGGELTAGRFIGTQDGREQVTDAGAVQGGDEMQLGEIDKLQTALQFVTHPVTLGFFQPIPLVDGDHQGTAGVEDKAQQVGILLAHTFVGIDHQHHHVGLFDSLQGLDDAEFLQLVTDLAPTPHTGGIDEGVFLPAALEGHIDTVAGGARHVVGQHPFFAKDAIDEGGLADIGPAEDGDLDAAILDVLFLIGLWQAGQHNVYQWANTAAM